MRYFIITNDFNCPNCSCRAHVSGLTGNNEFAICLNCKNECNFTGDTCIDLDNVHGLVKYFEISKDMYNLLII